MKKSKSSKKSKKQCLDCNGRRWKLIPHPDNGHWILDSCKACTENVYKDREWSDMVAHHMLNNLIAMLKNFGLDRVSIIGILDLLDKKEN